MAKHNSIIIWAIALSSLYLGYELLAAPSNVVAYSLDFGWLEIIEGLALIYVEIKR